MSMRVTSSMITASSLSNLQASLTRMQELQNQASSGKKLSKPSDDPTGINQSLRTRADLARNEQYSKNAQDGMARLGMADDTVSDMLTSLDKVRTLVVQAANTGVTDKESRQAIAEEVKVIKAGLIQSANTTYNGVSLFAGTANVTQAYDTSGNYLGNNGAINRTVGANATVQVNVPGSAIFGSGSTSLFSTIDDVITKLESTDDTVVASLASGTGSSLESIDANRINMQNRHSEIGARYHRVETMQDRAAEDKITLASTLSKVEDADAAETYLKFTSQQAAYQAALAATAKVTQPSLIQFLS